MILGAEVQYETAVKLLRQCGGNIQRAVNAHYDSFDGRSSGPAKPAKALPKPQPSPLVSSQPQLLILLALSMRHRSERSRSI